MPDGEVGPRRHWISRIHYQVLAGHPELETVRHPAPENGVERQFPRNAGDSWLFKVKDGVERVRFGDAGWRIGYARDAINSYFVFKTLREQGRACRSICASRCRSPRSTARCRRGFSRTKPISTKSGRASPKRSPPKSTPSSSNIPNDDLAIQWDCSTEVQDAYGAVPGYSADGAIERNVAQFRTLSPRIPESCRSSAITSASARSAAGRALRPPICRRPSSLPTPPSRPPAAASTGFTFRCCPTSSDSFFAPLKNLKPRGARVYLGVIHHMDGFKERIALARKFLPDFGARRPIAASAACRRPRCRGARRASAGDQGRALASDVTQGGST